jgi:hypothetical protein
LEKYHLATLLKILFTTMMVARRRVKMMGTTSMVNELKLHG